jgi:DNA-binding transcriptional regulator YdaS (Cro superfamily)
MRRMSKSIAAYRRECDLSLEQFARAFRVHKTTAMRWEQKRVPAERVLDVERITGISRHELRPDLYPWGGK